MKRTAGLLLLLLLLSITCPAQDEVFFLSQNRPEVAVGIGSGDAMFAFIVRNDLDRKNVRYHMMHLGPAYTFDYAHPLNHRVSIGPAFSAQALTLSPWTHNLSMPGNAVYKLVRFNFGLRALFNYNLDQNWKMYFGFRPGFTVWQTRPGTIPIPDIRLNLSTLPSMQVLGGVKYYMGDLGIGVEAALGTAPYLFQGNLTQRF